MQPQTKYAKSGDVNIAYQVFGGGPDLIITFGALSHLDLFWEEPTHARFLHRLSSFARVIAFDKRGVGLSDRVTHPTLEEWTDDIEAVMAAAGSTRAVLFGISEGGPASLLLAATHPDQCSALVLYGSFAKMLKGPDYPWGWGREDLEATVAKNLTNWGDGSTLAVFAPSRVNEKPFFEWWRKLERAGVSPSAMAALMRSWEGIDVRSLLSAIHVPTLVIHRARELAVNVGAGRFLAQQIPGAKYVELSGEDHNPYSGDQDALLDEVEEFLTGMRHARETDRVLATVLFTDIVGSTQRAATLGDRAWRDLLGTFYSTVRKELGRYRGKEVNTAGDSFLATFDGPARAIRCARAIRDSLHPLGIQVRTGLHTGECELMGDDVGGIAVHIGARVAAIAAPDEVLVSSTVKDLVAGSGMSFKDRGTHELKGVPDAWRLFQVGDS